MATSSARHNSYDNAISIIKGLFSMSIYIWIFLIERLYFITLRFQPTNVLGTHFFTPDNEFTYGMIIIDSLIT